MSDTKLSFLQRSVTLEHEDGFTVKAYGATGKYTGQDVGNTANTLIGEDTVVCTEPARLVVVAVAVVFGSLSNAGTYVRIKIDGGVKAGAYGNVPGDFVALEQWTAGFGIGIVVYEQNVAAGSYVVRAEGTGAFGGRCAGAMSCQAVSA